MKYGGTARADDPVPRRYQPWVIRLALSHGLRPWLIKCSTPEGLMWVAVPASTCVMTPVGLMWAVVPVSYTSAMGDTSGSQPWVAPMANQMFNPGGVDVGHTATIAY